MEPCPEGSEMTETESAEDDNSEMPVGWPKLDEKISSRPDREEILLLCADLISRLHSRACCNRFIEREGDKTRVSYARTLVSALQTYGTLLKDSELDSLKRRIEALEQLKGVKE